MKKVILTLVFFCSFALALAVVPKAKLDKQMILKDKTDSIYLLLTFDVAKIKADNNRSSLNLSLVIDRSGSMSNKGKLQYAKKASKMIVDKLNSSDILSIIEYDGAVNILWPSSPVFSKKMINKRIDTLFPRGSTNLTGGMVKGADEVKKNYNQQKINRVILLSDGMANQGITSQYEINKIVSKYKSKGIAISTMGLGLSYNEDLMQSIAEYGGGKYYYIESPSQMNSIFAEEINTLFTTVAKDVKLEFKAQDFVKKMEVFEFKSTIQNNTTNIEMSDFFSEDNRMVLIKLDVEPKKLGKIILGHLNLKYLDMAKNKPSGINFAIEVEVTDSQKLVNESLNIDVKSEVVMMETEREHKKYTKMYEEGNTAPARMGIEKLAKKVKLINANLKNVLLEKKIEALNMEKEEIDEAEKNLQNRSRYLKNSKSRSYHNLKGSKTKIVQQVGDKGYDVKQLQKKLKAKNLYKGEIDGSYDEELKKSVEQYQQQNRIKSDGVAGPRTLKKLELY